MAMDQTKPGVPIGPVATGSRAVCGHGWFYYVAIAAASLAVLCLSANTSFVDFPRLCRLMAQDGFLPRLFAIPGRRLVYSVGVLFLAVGSAALLIGFGGITDRLIPLFAVGAFLSFTLSQIGMAAHWRRSLRGDNRAATQQRSRLLICMKLAINAGGAVATATALAVIVLAKFLAGAWVTAIVGIALFWLMRTIHQHYDLIDAELLSGRDRRIDLSHHPRPLALVPLERWDRMARRAVRYAISMSTEVTAVHVVDLQGADADRYAADLRHEWHCFVEQPAREANITPPRLSIVSSPYRSILAPLLRAIQSASRREPDRPILVVLPALMERGFGLLLRTHRDLRIRARLLRDGGSQVAVLSVPWHVARAEPARALEEEEPSDDTTGAGRRKPRPADDPL